MELYYLMSITDRDRAEDMAALYRDAGLNLVCESVTCCDAPDDAALEACRALGKALVE